MRSRIYCKERNRTEQIARENPDAGDVWLWVCVDADSKLVLSWRLGQRDLATAKDFVEDIAKRVSGRVQIATDALRTYLNVIEDAFGSEIDYAQLHKVYRAPLENETRYSPAKCIGCDIYTRLSNVDNTILVHVRSRIKSRLTQFLTERGFDNCKVRAVDLTVIVPQRPEMTRSHRT